MSTSNSDICLYLLAVFLPPVAVTLKAGCGSDSLINGVLMLLGWLPGLLHAWWVISTYSSRKRAPSPQPAPYSYSQPPSYAYEHFNQSGVPPSSASAPVIGSLPHPQERRRAPSSSNADNGMEKKEE